VSLASLLGQLLNGLAGASSLFLVAAGLSLVFGVTRVVNFAHGSLYMLGLYVAYSLIAAFGGGFVAFWGAIALAAAMAVCWPSMTNRPSAVSAQTQGLYFAQSQPATIFLMRPMDLPDRPRW